MEALPKEKRKKKGTVHKFNVTPPFMKSRAKEPIVYPMRPEEGKVLLEELLGNFSDQTGACFG
jgi:hypothetical protein